MEQQETSTRLRDFKTPGTPPETNDAKTCALEGCEAEGVKPLGGCCAQCLSVSYCSKDHQRRDWARHKETCKRIALSIPTSTTAAKKESAHLGSTNASKVEIEADAHRRMSTDQPAKDFCQICDKRVGKKNWSSHINGKGHRKKKRMNEERMNKERIALRTFVIKRRPYISAVPQAVSKT